MHTIHSYNHTFTVFTHPHVHFWCNDIKLYTVCAGFWTREFLTQYCLCPVGFCPAPPHSSSVPPSEVTRHSLFCPSQWHWQEMTSHAENESTPLDNKPLHLGSKVSRVTGESVHVFEMCMRVDSDQLSAVDSLSDSRVCVNGFVVFQASVSVHACCQDLLKSVCLCERHTRTGCTRISVLPGIGL